MLATLREFFTIERDHHGSYFSPRECVLNGIRRRASCRTDAELLRLRDAAMEFARMMEAELVSRDVDAEHKAGCQLCGADDHVAEDCEVAASWR